MIDPRHPAIFDGHNDLLLRLWRAEPHLRDRVWLEGDGQGHLDLPRMREAARPLMGEHDFAAFCRSRPGTTTTRRLRSLGIRRVRGLVEVRLVADAFCWQMVRGIVGHLLLVGDGRRDPAATAAVLAAADRSRAGNIAPPHGLVLEAVSYASGRRRQPPAS